MTETSWTLVANIKNLKDDTIKSFKVKDKSIILIKKGNEIYALSNKCPHMSCPLSGGTLIDFYLVCPCHGWRFDIKTGSYLSSKDYSLDSYETKINDGNILVNI